MFSHWKTTGEKARVVLSTPNCLSDQQNQRMNPTHILLTPSLQNILSEVKDEAMKIHYLWS